MINFKNKITGFARLAFALLASLALVACGGGGGGGGSGDTGTPTTPVVQQEPIQAGVVMAKPLMDVAMVGQPYENTVAVVPNDRRNEIVSLAITNPTAGGAQPSIDNTGLVTWTANDADFASTKVLRVTAKLKEGADVTVDTPVEVRNERLVYEVALGPDEASYSDPEGRYLVRVKRLNPSLPIIGILRIVEVFQATGYFIPSFRIANESNTDFVIIEQPISDPAAQAGGLVTQAQVTYPLQVTPSFPVVNGSLVRDGNNVYSSRDWFAFRKISPNLFTEYKVSDTAEVFSFLASCDSAQACRAMPQSPVILIHGFTPEILGLGGGERTWGKLPDALIAKGHPVFEMQWMTHMRFEEAAGVLAKFGQTVAMLTGNKPIIIAHSFGGVVAHLALQGKGIEFSGSTWKPVNVIPNDVFSQLITLDSPLSGISDSRQNNVQINTAGATHSFTYGRDASDTTISHCASITCLQAGAFDMNLIKQVEIKLNLSRIDPSLNASNAIFPGESIARIQKNQTTIPFLTVTGTHLLPKDVNNETSSAYRLGDGLISLMGQSVDPTDFATDPYSILMSIGMRMADGEIISLNELNLLQTGGDCLKKNTNSRYYWICAKASHNSLKRLPVDDYGIAHYEDNIQGGGIHPLQTLIDDPERIAKPKMPYGAAITVPISFVRGSVVSGIFPLAARPMSNLLIRAVLIEKSTGIENYSVRLRANQNGEFNIDVGSLLMSRVGVAGDLNLGNYSLRLYMGGEKGTSTRLHIQHIEFLGPDHDLGVIDLSLSTALVDVTGIVIDGQTISTPIAGADVWLSQGIDQTAERLRLLADNNVARKVTTDALGRFSVPGLRPGDYSALVSKAGYNDQLQGRVRVATNGSLSFSLLRALNPGEAAITLRWSGAAGGSLVSSDLDSHLIRLNSLGAVDYHIYYGNKTVLGLLDSLDRDDVDYEGPETITLALTSGMNYAYYVHNFSSYGTTIPGSYPRVTLNLGNSVQQFELPLAVNTAGRYWRVFDIVNGQVNRCLTNCLQGITPSGLQTQASSTVLVPQLFSVLFENLPAKQ